MLPKEPAILLSYINLKLRDNYSSLADMCEDLDISYGECLDAISSAGLFYDEEKNCLREK